MSDKHQTDQVKIPQVYAARTDVGCVREHNEDSFIAATPLFVVADGMGGHEAGEVASEIAINTLLEKAPSSPDGEGLANAVRAANIAIISAAAQGVGRPGCPRGAAGTEDQHLFPGKLQLQAANQGSHSEKVCIVAIESALSVHDSVYCPDSLRPVRYFIQKGDHTLFVGNSHIDAHKIPAVKKRL